MAKPNYSFEKRQRDLEKKRKQEEKRQRKLERKSGEGDAETASAVDEATPGALPPEGSVG